jgi:hypothetical protein
MGAPAPRPNSFLLVECNLGYAAWLLRPRALGAPVAMTYRWELGYANKGIAQQLYSNRQVNPVARPKG